MSAEVLFTLDVGNSGLGLGTWRGGQLEVTRRIDPQDTARDLVAAWAASPRAEVVAISVSTDRLRGLLGALGEQAARVRLLRDPPLELADPRLAGTAGADRLANALALAPGPGIAVDAGTAVTVDLVDGRGRYLGGFIAPGPAVAARGLAAGTAQLPQLSGEPVPIEPGGETHAALSAGLWGLAVGGVDRLVEAALERLSDEASAAAPLLVATGAGGRHWARDSRHVGITCDDTLVHRGMRTWARS